MLNLFTVLTEVKEILGGNPDFVLIHWLYRQQECSLIQCDMHNKKPNTRTES